MHHASMERNLERLHGMFGWCTIAHENPIVARTNSGSWYDPGSDKYQQYVSGMNATRFGTLYAPSCDDLLVVRNRAQKAWGYRLNTNITQFLQLHAPNRRSFQKRQFSRLCVVLRFRLRAPRARPDYQWAYQSWIKRTTSLTSRHCHSSADPPLLLD